MCKKNVQTGCTGYVHIAAMRMVENNVLQFIKLSPVNVIFYRLKKSDKETPHHVNELVSIFCFPHIACGA